MGPNRRGSSKLRASLVGCSRRAGWFCLQAVTACLFLAAVESVRAEEMPVPPELQAAIFKKVFSYDKSLQAGSSPQVVVAFTDASSKIKDRVVKAFQEVAVPVKAVRAEDVGSGIPGNSVLYVACGEKSFRDVCEKNGILSITGIPALVESGEVSVGLGLADNKPKIIVHLKRLKAERHEMSANLLQLARLIQ